MCMSHMYVLMTDTGPAICIHIKCHSRLTRKMTEKVLPYLFVPCACPNNVHSFCNMCMSHVYVPCVCPMCMSQCWTYVLPYVYVPCVFPMFMSHVYVSMTDTGRSVCVCLMCMAHVYFPCVCPNDGQRSCYL